MRSNRYSLFLVGLALLFLNSIIGCVQPQSEAYQEGYKSGFTAGFKAAGLAQSPLQTLPPSSITPQRGTETSATTKPSPTVAAVLPRGTEAKVIRVVDGDTIEVDLNGKIYKVRYIGIDTPETVHPSKPVEYMGREASAKNKELVEGKVVRLEKDVSETDKYGRLLRYVYVDELFVNAELVRLGYAQVVTYPPDVKYQDLFLSLQREARETGKGLWAAPLTTISSPKLSTIPIPTPAPLIVPAPPPASTPTTVQITRIFYDGLVPRVESDEYVEITNLGTEPVDLNRWVLKDITDRNQAFTFPSYILQPGKSIRVYTNEIHPEYGGFSFGSGRAIWNNSQPDTAALYNAQGQEISKKSY